MGWHWFALGFVAFPIVVVAVMYVVSRLTQTTPTAVNTQADLQSVLRAFLEAGKHNETLFIVWRPVEFEVRVTRRDRKAQRATMDVEVRNSGDNRGYYPQAKTALETAGLEFTESFTPARQQPTRLRLDWPDGGPFVVSALANAIQIVGAALPQSPDSDRLAACQPPSLWRGDMVRRT